MKYLAAVLLIFCSFTSFARGKYVSVIVTIAKTDTNTNLIVYGSRQLTLDDFQGPVDNNVLSYTAVTFSAIDIKCTYEESVDSIKANVIITPYFDKTKSWCKTSGHNEHTLAHEQLHFDLTALKACELVKRIQTTHFTKADFSKELHDVNQSLLNEVATEQDKYDNLTHHGILTDKQAEESARIKALLQKSWCYN